MTQSSYAGQDTSYNNALTLRHGGKGQGACVPWVAEVVQCCSLN